MKLLPATLDNLVTASMDESTSPTLSLSPGEPVVLSHDEMKALEAEKIVTGKALSIREQKKPSSVISC